MVTSGEYSPGRFLAHELSRATIAAIVIAAAATGCRSGTSAMSAPSWWSFGGKNTDPERLSAAPPFTGEIKKPSASATPYPTTNMPNTYSLADAASGPPAQPVAPPAEPGTVTYGSRPSAPEAPLASTAPAAAAAPDAAGKPQISAQVGPYASLADAAPPAATSNVTPPPAVPAPAVPFAAAPPASAAPPATFPATAGYEPSQAARPSEPSYQAPQNPAPAMAGTGTPLVPPTRYASAVGSRFSGSGPAAPPALEPADAAGSSTQPAPFGAAPAASVAPPPLPTPPPPLPGAPPLPAPPANAPPRRPDPGYRPAGTSDYRPAKAILVDGASPPPPAVRQASFEEPLGPAR